MPSTARRPTASTSASPRAARPPALVVSGINKGYNLGDDVTYSGTVAGALEGALLGVPGIAVSLERTAESSTSGLPRRRPRARGPRAGPGLPARTLLNVNVPRGPSPRRATVQGKRNHVTKVTESIDPRGRPTTGSRKARTPRTTAIAPISAVRDGYVSVTPLQPDLTAPRGAAAGRKARLRRWRPPPRAQLSRTSRTLRASASMVNGFSSRTGAGRRCAAERQVAGVAGHEQHLDRRAVQGDELRRLRAVHVRHHHVGDQDVDRALKALREQERLAAVADVEHLVAAQHQPFPRQLPHVVVVLDQQDGLVAGGRQPGDAVDAVGVIGSATAAGRS